MTEQNTQNPPAGWHPDPEQPGHLRFWDGTAWTDQRQPAPAMPMAQQPFYGQPPVKPKKAWYKRWWAITLGVFIALMIISGLSGGGETPATDETSSSAAEAPADPAPPAEAPAEDTAPAEEAAAPAPAEKPAKEFDMAVKAGKMLKEYEDNELSADKVYDGKTLKVTGVVDKIDTDVFDDEKYILRLTGGGDFEFLSVNVEGLSEDELSTIKTGQTVTVIAEFDDGGDLGVEMTDGHLA